MEIVGETNSVTQALEVARQKQPDVICLDIELRWNESLDFRDVLGCKKRNSAPRPECLRCAKVISVILV